MMFLPRLLRYKGHETCLHCRPHTGVSVQCIPQPRCLVSVFLLLQVHVLKAMTQVACFLLEIIKPRSYQKQNIICSKSPGLKVIRSSVLFVPNHHISWLSDVAHCVLQNKGTSSLSQIRHLFIPKRHHASELQTGSCVQVAFNLQLLPSNVNFCTAITLLIYTENSNCQNKHYVLFRRFADRTS